MKFLIDFIKSRQALNAKKLEEAAEIPRNTLQNVLNGSRDALPDKHVWALCEVLSRYGLELGGWKFAYDNDVHCFIVETPTGNEVETIEHDDEPGVWFEYRVSLHRSLISDEFELIEFIKAIK